jgi:UDP-glucose 4-epimerase
MRVLVTGGAGFIGSNLVALLLKNNIEVRVLDDLSTGYVENLDGLDCEFIEGTILEPKTCEKAAKNCDAIVHLAALGSVPRSIDDPIRTHEVNVTGTLNMLEVARLNFSHFTFASSSSVYGYVETLPREENMPTRPSSPYGASKLSAEAYVLSYAKSFDLKVMPLRFFNVYGPKQSAGHAYAAVIPNFINAALIVDTLYVDGDGEQTRDFTFVDSVTDIILQSIQGTKYSDIPINLALGSSTSINELIVLLQNQLGIALKVKNRDKRIGDVKRSPSNPERLFSIFPNVKSVDIEEGLSATISWYENKLRSDK